jgi:hypothetical protein
MTSTMADLRPLLDAVSPSRTLPDIDATYQTVGDNPALSVSPRRSSRGSESTIGIAIRITTSRLAPSTRAADLHEARRRPPTPARAMVDCCVLYAAFDWGWCERQRKRGAKVQIGF